ncbi:hypothetical protein PXH80_33760, partial [Mycolicibacterium smegmatis]|nr:hypothetical protein [Mycolicibacterium smegmatis]
GARGRGVGVQHDLVLGRQEHRLAQDGAGMFGVFGRGEVGVRALGRKTVEFYLDLSNYVNNWRKLGFTDSDVEKPGSDKLIDA